MWEGIAASDACVTISYQGLMSMLGLVHGKDTGCPGKLRRMTTVGSIADRVTISADCRTCGAFLGGLRVDVPTPVDVALGILLAGRTHDKYAACNALANVDWLPEKTLK